MGLIRQWREDQEEAVIQEAVGLLQARAVLAVPTETFYALAVNPFREDALARLFALKERSPAKPVLLLVSSREMLLQVARKVPELAGRLMDRFWPGPLTLILPARAGLPGLLTGGTDTIGVRRPRQDVTLRLVTALGFPVTGTSANRAGRPPLTRAADVAAEFGEGVDLILDAGPCPGGLPSTIVDVSGPSPAWCGPGPLPRAG